MALLRESRAVIKPQRSDSPSSSKTPSESRTRSPLEPSKLQSIRSIEMDHGGARPVCIPCVGLSLLPCKVLLCAGQCRQPLVSTSSNHARFARWLVRQRSH